ncbi:MAG: hypothetical protein VXZ38_12075 [Planctomycetota bacterium]|nr:hypothetical protein [Planctomycetota bacterium]
MQARNLIKERREHWNAAGDSLQSVGVENAFQLARRGAEMVLSLSA